MPNQLGQLQDRGINRALQQRFSLPPDFSISLMPELAATMALPSEELLFHAGWKRWTRGAQIAAVAGNAGRFQIRVPDNATIIVVVESVRIAAAAADTYGVSFGYGPGNVDLATVSSSQLFCDGRLGLFGGQTQSQTKVSWGTGAVVSQSLFSEPLLASTVVSYPGCPIIMVPGNSLLFGVGNVNELVFFDFTFRERVLQEQENTP